MILKGKIKNKEEIHKLYQQINLNENRHETPKIKKNFLKSLSCPLCFRFQNLPKKHEKCGQRFCHQCITKWIEIFPFCPKCKTDLTPADIANSEIDEDFNLLTKKIKIKCKLGKCGKEDEIYQAVTSMPVIHEREMNEETSAEEDEINEKNFFWNFFNRRKSKKSLQNSDMMSVENSNINNSDFNSINQSSSSVFNSLDGSSLIISEVKQKRYFYVNDYILHLVRKHAWPIMQITHENDSNKISYVGYKMEKHLKVPEKMKLGPGVIHTVGPDRGVTSLVGIYLNDKLKKCVRIFKEMQLIFEGKLVNGLYEDLGVLKHYFDLEFEDYENNEGVQCYLEYKGNFKHGKFYGKGELNFVGDYDKVKKIFQEKNKNILESELNVDFFQSQNSVSVLSDFFTKYSNFENQTTNFNHINGKFLKKLTIIESNNYESKISNLSKNKLKSTFILNYSN